MFNNFKDTIFYKNDSEIEYKVKALELLQLEYPNNAQIKKQLKECKIELKNEREIEKILEKSNIGMYVIRDLNVAYKDLKAQIDYIAITAGFIYLIECHNLYGNIAVNELGEFYKKVKDGEKNSIEQIESPLMVGDKHKTILRKLWSSKINIKEKKKFEDAFDKSYKVIAVINSRKSNISFKNTPSNIRNRVIESDNLLKYIKSDLEKFYTRKDLIDNKDEMHGHAYRLMDFNVDSNSNWEQKYRRLFNLKPIITVEEKKEHKPKEKKETNKISKTKKTLKNEKTSTQTKGKKTKEITKKKNVSAVENLKNSKKSKSVSLNSKTELKKEKALKSETSSKPKKKVQEKNTTKEIKKKVEAPKKKTSIPKSDDKLNQIKDLMTISAMNTSKDINVKLKKMLTNYRQKKYKENNVPDYYVFSDDELNSLISKKPKSVEELKRKKILTPVKIRMFGEDIVKIIKKVDI